MGSPRCPRCKQYPAYIDERWDVGLQFDVDTTGEVSKTGIKTDAHSLPYKLIAHCDCGHKWTIREKTQITDLT
jgi:hypothetical protein